MTEPTNRYKALRDVLGLTQAEAAEACGVAFPTWQAWEYWRRVPGRMAKPGLEKLQRKAEKLEKGKEKCMENHKR